MSIFYLPDGTAILRTILCLGGLLATDLGFSQTVAPALEANSQNQPASASEIAIPGPQTQRTDLRLGRGDLVELTVFSAVGAPELNSKSRVNASGELSVPLIGSLQVAGLTVQEAQTSIARRFQDEEILKSPTVLMFVSEYVNQGVSVLGEVAKPGVYNMLSSRRLLDMISEAGGLTPMAGQVATITHRNDPKAPVVVALSRDATQASANNQEVFPGDTIVVGKAGVVYVVGAVNKPGGFPMDANEGLSVLQALALAEGSKPNASLDKAKLIRKTYKWPGGGRDPPEQDSFL